MSFFPHPERVLVPRLRSGCAAVLVSGLLWLGQACGSQAHAGSATNEADPSLYPRNAAEIKAMLNVLAPDRGASFSVQNAYIERLKQYRYLCGVPYEDIQWDSQLAVLAQKAAQVCAKLNKLTHNPEKPAGMSDEDYELGKKGAGRSNLYQGIVQPAACVDGWMDDSDPKNIDRVGHRRWCLNPGMLKTAFGAEGGFAAMLAHDRSRQPVPDWDFVAYPARGYMPAEFFGSRRAWSLSLNTGKYAVPKKEGVQVSIWPADEKHEPCGDALKLDYLNVENGGFGSGPAIIFRPAVLSLAPDACYLVEIAGLKSKGGKPAAIRYLVHFIVLQKIPYGPESGVVYTAYLQNRLKAAQGLGDKLDQLEALSGLMEDKSLDLADPAVATALRSSLAELLKDPAMRREQEAAQQYRMVADFEHKAGKKKDKLVQAALGYRDLAEEYKGTRAGQKAAEDFERLKKIAQ